MTTLVIDCETYADPTAYSDEDQLTLVDAANKRDMEVGKFIACSPPLARLVLVGLLNVETGKRCVVYDGELLHSPELDDVVLQPAGGEHGVLVAVHTMLAKASRLVSFNGRSYDLPLLLLRAMRHGVEPAKIVERAAWMKPWESEPHVDVMNRLTFGGATGRYGLGAYAIGLGIPSPKQGGDGTKVAELVKARNGTDLAGYCLDDCAATLALARKAGVLPVEARAERAA